MATDKIEHSLQLDIVNLSKKFNRNLLFKNLHLSVTSGNVVAITGANGSGKSTLLKIISGLIPPNTGEIILSSGGAQIKKEVYYKHINICAPYVDLIDDFTLNEHITFHSKFKKPLSRTILKEEITASGLNGAYNTPLKDFSSGMKQRVKLILATCFSGKIILMDEPTSHLDKTGKAWYNGLVSKRITDSILLIFSNEEAEFVNFTKKIINIDILKH